MRVLLDTHTILWIISDDPKLIPRVRKTITEASKVHWSMVSIWEISIKISLDRPDFKLAQGWSKRIPEEMALNGFYQVPLAPDHLETLSKLPFLHRDPFDRILIATAIAEDFKIVTNDQKFHNYPVDVLW